MFIDPRMTSPYWLRFERAEDNWAFYHSRICPLFRTEPKWRLQRSINISPLTGVKPVVP